MQYSHKFFSVKVFSISFWQTLDYWSLRRNSFSAKYRPKSDHNIDQLTSCEFKRDTTEQFNSVGDHIWALNPLFRSFQVWRLTKMNRKKIYTKNVSKFVGSVPETVLSLWFIFRKKIIFIHFCQTSDYWSLRKNAFAAQIWSPAQYWLKIMHFSHTFFSAKIFSY
jgi:hypothetical protein